LNRVRVGKSSHNHQPCDPDHAGGGQPPKRSRRSACSAALLATIACADKRGLSNGGPELTSRHPRTVAAKKGSGMYVAHKQSPYLYSNYTTLFLFFIGSMLANLF
jgi:hypothetical protein